jgi:DNA-binding NtrC family response regulator
MDLQLPGSASAPIRAVVACADGVFAEGLQSALVVHHIEVEVCSLAELEPAVKLRLGSLDVVVMEVSELAVIDRLRQIAPLVEVVAVFTEQGVEGAVHALRAGAYAVLHDPFSERELVEAVRRACVRKRKAEMRIGQLNRERWESKP